VKNLKILKYEMVMFNLHCCSFRTLVTKIATIKLHRMMCRCFLVTRLSKGYSIVGKEKSKTNAQQKLGGGEGNSHASN